MKKLIIFSSFILFTFCALAQRGQGKGKWEGFEEFRAQKITFMTEKLELTPDEAQVFWPHYNEFDKQRLEFHKKKREVERNVWENLENFTDKELDEAHQTLMKLRDEEHELNKKYRQKFYEILPPKKALALDYIEHQFRSHMFKEYRKRKQED